jgi:cation diffusion facilitator CzcD-associated flavoprotein CzcO
VTGPAYQAHVGRHPRIAIIGAGFGGLAAAIELRKHGFDADVFERADAVGGVWRANTYPGAACDVPSSIYSYSFALDNHWQARFGTQAEICEYLRRCADSYGVTPRIHFRTEVSAATFEDNVWRLRLATGESLDFDVLVCATGLLSSPRIPVVEGQDAFTGQMFHSASWDHSVNLRDRRVAVVGSGASAVQLVPEIVETVAHLDVIQRSPNWVVNRYSFKTSAPVRWAFRRWPRLRRARHMLDFLWYEARAPLIYRALDPVRALLHAWMRFKIRREIRDPELRKTVTPSYMAMCNRLLMSNDWYRALDQAHVAVHPSGVRKVLPDGVELADGTAIEAEVIIWCTGFAADEYPATIEVTGRGGRRLRDDWSAGPEAYFGIAVSGYPNLFMMYGPGTASNVNSVIFMLEKEARYIRTIVQDIARHGGWRDVREPVQREYNAWRDRQLDKTVYAAGCPGWLTAEAGKVFAVWPGTHTAFARATRQVDLDAYERGGVPA